MRNLNSMDQMGQGMEWVLRPRVPNDVTSFQDNFHGAVSSACSISELGGSSDTGGTKGGE